MEASRSQTASVVGAGSVERPRLERSNSARLRALVEIEVEPAAPVGVREAEQCGSSNIGKTGNFVGTEHDRTEGVPQVFPGVADLNRRFPLRQSDVAPHRHSLGQ